MKPNYDADNRRLFRATVVALFICAGLVAICYWFVDRPVAFFIYDHEFPQIAFLKWLTEIPPIVQAWSPLAIVLVMLLRVRRPFRPVERVVLAACVGMIVADQFRESLAVVFGRYWPETWTHDNPSLIGNGAYGFHFFHSGVEYGSFPSGHMTRTAAVAAAIWVGAPRWRRAGVAAVIVMAIALIGMNYHFVGDVIAGTFLGAIVGVWTARLCGIPGRGLQFAPES